MIVPSFFFPGGGRLSFLTWLWQLWLVCFKETVIDIFQVFDFRFHVVVLFGRFSFFSKKAFSKV